jgi:hypothetical protein
MDLRYVEGHEIAGPPPHSPQATIVLMQPLSHFRTDFSVENFKLEDFVRRGR